ncbi:MAG TPA: hypothetical protein VFN35_28875 [Ktedonobacteraceae bacterium]|nr:hypothetical protein [Ktedonobacteraceae bacterium]
MARNAEENVYITIAFSRDSVTWQDLRREATDLDLSVAHLIKVLLADRTLALQGHGKQLWFPRESIRGSSGTVSPVQPEQRAHVQQEVQTSRRAASAAQYWNE